MKNILIYQYHLLKKLWPGTSLFLVFNLQETMRDYMSLFHWLDMPHTMKRLTQKTLGFPGYHFEMTLWIHDFLPLFSFSENWNWVSTKQLLEILKELCIMYFEKSAKPGKTCLWRHEHKEAVALHQLSNNKTVFSMSSSYNPQRVIYYQQNAIILIINNLLRFSLRRDTAIDTSCLLGKLIIIRQSKSFCKLEY